LPQPHWIFAATIISAAIWGTLGAWACVVLF
jgi:hypothetical protein